MAQIDINRLNSYFSTLQSFEELESLLHSRSPLRSTIYNKLQELWYKINSLLSTEIENSTNFIALWQLQNQNVILQRHLESKMENPRKNTTIENCSSKKLGPTNRQENIMDIVVNTREVPMVTGFSEILGLHDVIKLLKSMVMLPINQPQLFKNYERSNSIMLYGPPGTGKTRIVHALAAEINAALHCVASGDLLSSYLGQTEKNIKALFKYMKGTEQFTILFFDEIDGICRKRSDNEQEHSRRVKTELMCQLSHLSKYKNLFFIAATNCPWDLDNAILRRFQKQIYVPLPTRSDRLEYFKHFVKDKHLNCDWGPVLDMTEGYSGSDLHNLIQNAFFLPLTELEETKVWKQTEDGYFEPMPDFINGLQNIKCANLEDLPRESVKARPLKITDFLNAAYDMIPTVSLENIQRYERFGGK